MCMPVTGSALLAFGAIPGAIIGAIVGGIVALIQALRKRDGVTGRPTAPLPSPSQPRVQTACPECGQPLSIPMSGLGRLRVCPRCNAHLKVPPTVEEVIGRWGGSPPGSVWTAPSAVGQGAQYAMHCSQCGQRLQVPARALGGRWTCPLCEATVAVPRDLPSLGARPAAAPRGAVAAHPAIGAPPPSDASLSAIAPLPVAKGKAPLLVPAAAVGAAQRGAAREYRRGFELFKAVAGALLVVPLLAVVSIWSAMAPGKPPSLLLWTALGLGLGGILWCLIGTCVLHARRRVDRCPRCRARRPYYTADRGLEVTCPRCGQSWHAGRRR